MTILHIEHQITHYDTWRAAFDRFEQLRTDAGVAAHRVLRPIDDDRYVVVQLDFQDACQAAAFLDVLHTRIWANPDRSPALDGTPRTLRLQPADHSDTTLTASAHDAAQRGADVSFNTAGTRSASGNGGSDRFNA